MRVYFAWQQRCMRRDRNSSTSRGRMGLLCFPCADVRYRRGPRTAVARLIKSHKVSLVETQITRRSRQSPRQRLPPRGSARRPPRRRARGRPVWKSNFGRPTPSTRRNSLVDFHTETDGLHLAVGALRAARGARVGDVEGVEAIQRARVGCLLYTSPSPRDRQKSRMPSSA